MNFMPALAEIVMLIMVCVIMFADLFLGQRYKALSYALAQLTLIAAAVCTWRTLGPMAEITFDGQFVLDRLAGILKMFMYVATFASFLFSRRYIADRHIPSGEFYLLTLLSLLGAMVLVSANSLLTLYIGLELLSLPLYALVAIRREAGKCSEAAMKYFIMGALASGMLLYGMSLIYGETGSIILPTIASSLNNQANSVVLFGTAFVLVASCFKLGAAPFHMWVPDVYEGSPTAVTIYLGSVPKLAAFAMLIRLLVEALPAAAGHWQAALSAIALLCLIGGNLAALMQKNFKRLLAYSTIGHVGFILLGVAMGTFSSYGAALFYSLIYILMAVGGFAVILILSKVGFEADKIDDFAGLNNRHAWLAFMLMLLLLSLAGIPPLVGFTAKLMVLKSLVDQQHYYLAFIALFMSVIAAYYYIRVIKVMYFDAPMQVAKIELPTDMVVAISVNGLLMLGLGMLPAGLIAYCYQVFAG